MTCATSGNLSPETRTRLRAGPAQGRQAGWPRTTLIYPALSGRGFRRTLAANAIANLVRNVWSHSVIMCGHFPEGVETFEHEALDEDETRGEWYLRQMLGSADISGGPLLHLMTGNLSHQIEHHLYPDLPSNRYAEIARRGRGPVPALRAQLQHPPAGAPGGLGLAPGAPALAAQRVAGRDEPRQRRSPAGRAGPDGEARGLMRGIASAWFR